MSPISDISNTELILLAMALAGASEDYKDIEDIALEAYQLSPQRFGWRTRSYVSDKIAVQAIADLEAKHKDRLTLRGAGKAATRRLTAEGRRAALRAGAKVAGREFTDLGSLVAHFREPGAETPEPTPAERRRVQAELGELRRHRAYQVWADQDGDLSNVDHWQLLDALSCLPDAQTWAIRNQSEKLMELAERWQDSELVKFIEALRKELANEDYKLEKE